MHRFAIVFVTLVLFVTGCAESVSKAEFAGMQQQVQQLKEENALLQAGANRTATPTAPSQGPVVNQPSAVPPPAMAVMPPPAQPAVYGPPQNWAWTTPPKDCETGPYSLPIKNRTRSAYVTVLLDGEALVIRGAHGVLPHLPAGETVYVCLAWLGTHTISGVGYEKRMGVLYEIPGEAGHFQTTKEFTTSSVFDGRQFSFILRD